MENDEVNYAPSTYNIVEVIKPIEGSVGKKVKIWDAPTSCGIHIPLGIVQLFVVEPYPKNSFYTDQLISNGASSPAIIAYLIDGIDISANGSLHAPYLAEEEIRTKCQNSSTSELPDFCIPEETINKIYKVYENELTLVTKLVNKEPWWRFKKN